MPNHTLIMLKLVKAGLKLEDGLLEPQIVL